MRNPPSMLRSFAVLSLLTGAAFAQTAFTVGNLVVVRIGDGVAPLTNASTATFLDEYTPAGTLVQSIAMPTAPSGANQPLTNSGTATSEGFLNMSPNGLFLTLAGYSAAPGLASIATTTAASTPRVIARVDLSASVDTSTTITDGYNGTPPSGTSTGSSGNPRAAVTTDGNGFWTSGTGATANAGVRFVPYGGSTSTAINAGGPANTRVVGIYNGQLYTTSASTVYQGVCSVGSGLPVAGPQPVTLLPGLPTATGPSAYDFWFADPATLYVADDRAPPAGGIQKYALVAGAWTLQYTLSPTIGCRGLTGRRVNGTTTLWATTGSQLVTVDDTGAASVVTTLASAGNNTALRGVRVLQKPTTLQRLPGACGAADIVATGTCEIGTDVITTILNPAGIPFIGYGLTPLGLPFCNCTVLHDFTVLVGGPQHTLPLPNNPALFGFLLMIQGLDFLAPGGCPNPLFALTDGYSFTIQ